MTFRKFQKIEQFRGTVKHVRDWCNHHQSPLPVLTFTGSVKLHGTNAAVGYDPHTDTIWCQSRERIITTFDDNAGFAAYVMANQEAFKSFLGKCYGNRLWSNSSGKIIMYGEWAGGNIQSGVAISNLVKNFYIFEVLTMRDSAQAGAEDEIAIVEQIELSDIDLVAASMVPNLHLITEYKTFSIDIDFNHPERVQNQLVDYTIEVEESCPVAAAHCVNGVGEGIVWYNAKTGLRFKTKGEKHSASKVKSVKAIAAVDLERLSSIDAFVDVVVTENRLQQGIDKLGEMGLPMEMKSLGAYLKWLSGDVLAEEGDLILASHLNKKELMPKVTLKAKNYFVEHLNKITFGETEYA